MVDDLVVDGLAGYALGRLVTHDTVSVTAVNALLGELVDVVVPDEALLGYDPQLVAAARPLLEARLNRALAARELDLRELHRAGWTDPVGRWARWLADLLSCPICVSFHVMWLAHVLTGRSRPWSPRWWVRLFAGWGAAQVLLRTAAPHGPSSTDDMVAQAIMEAQSAS